MVDGYIFKCQADIQVEAPDVRIDLKREDGGREQIAYRYKLKGEGR